jgi:hypothetical protein
VTTIASLPAAVAATPVLAMASGDIVRIVVTAVAIFVILKVGMTILGGFARPVPAPPDPGELRKVRLRYECTICGTEVRMTTANDEVPEPPRHCMEDMALVTPVDDI